MVFIQSTCSRRTSRTTSRVWCGAIWRIRHLRADSVVWLSHTSSIWPWSGAPKVRLYDTFLGSLRQLGSTAAARRRWPQHSIGGGSVAYADNDCNRTMTTMIDYWLFLSHGGGGGRGGGSTKPHFDLEVIKECKLVGMICMQPPPESLRDHQGLPPPLLLPWAAGGGRGLAACAAAGHQNGWQWRWHVQLFEGKRGWTRGEERENWRWVCIFMLYNFVIVFLLNLFKTGRLILYQVQVNCWTGFFCKISLPVVQIWSSHFCLAIIVWESTVANSCIWHWHKTGLQTF